MFEKGGPITFQSHEATCEKVTAKVVGFFVSKLEDSLGHHRELVKKEMELAMLNVQNSVGELVKKQLELVTVSVQNSVSQAVKAFKEANGSK